MNEEAIVIQSLTKGPAFLKVVFGTSEVNVWKLNASTISQKFIYS
jgi:hypothetical protein